jgi:HAD superfamily hydrolase (TIGR01549 family)
MVSFTGITTVLFDLDGTLRHSIPSGEEMLMDIAARLGAPSDADTRRSAAQWTHNYWAVSECLLIDLKTYDRESEEFWVNYARRQLEAIHVPEKQAEQWAVEIHRTMLESYQPVDTIFDDVFPTLGALCKGGYTLGLVTNRHSPIDEYLESVGLTEHLDFWFTAGEIGAWKPKPEIFTYALGQANAKPSQAVYVGDNYYADVVGARSAHIQPILLDSSNVFPDADCPVIKAIGDIPELLRLPQPG